MAHDNRELLQAIGRLEGKVDALVASVAEGKREHHDRMNRIDEDIEQLWAAQAKLRSEGAKKVAEVEKEVNRIDKVVYVITTVASLVWTVVFYFIQKLFP